MQRYYAVFEELGVSYVPSHGNFLMAELASAEHVNVVNEALLRRGIAIRPLGSFGFPSCIRITVGLPEENNMLFEALREILPTL